MKIFSPSKNISTIENYRFEEEKVKNYESEHVKRQLKAYKISMEMMICV